MHVYIRKSKDRTYSNVSGLGAILSPFAVFCIVISCRLLNQPAPDEAYKGKQEHQKSLCLLQETIDIEKLYPLPLSNDLDQLAGS